jgi:hypothetical protein
VTDLFKFRVWSALYLLADLGRCYLLTGQGRYLAAERAGCSLAGWAQHPALEQASYLAAQMTQRQAELELHPLRWHLPERRPRWAEKG